MATSIVKRRVICGWRNDAINRTLDYCASTEGYAEISWDSPKKLDTLGRAQKIYDDPNQKFQQYNRRNPEKIKAKFERRMLAYRVDYDRYVEAYSVQYPNSTPVTFTKFWKTGLRMKFMIDPTLAVELSFGLGDEMLDRLAEGKRKYKAIYQK